MAQALVQVNLERQADALCGEWSCAQDKWPCAQIEQKPLPDPRASFPKVVQAGFHLPSSTAVFRYLNRCLADKEVPKAQRPLRSLPPFLPSGARVLTPPTRCSGPSTCHSERSE